MSSSCIVKGGIPSSRRYLPTYLGNHSSKLWKYIMLLAQYTGNVVSLSGWLIEMDILIHNLSFYFTW